MAIPKAECARQIGVTTTAVAQGDNELKNLTASPFFLLLPILPKTQVDTAIGSLMGILEDGVPLPSIHLGDQLFELFPAPLAAKLNIATARGSRFWNWPRG